MLLYRHFREALSHVDFPKKVWELPPYCCPAGTSLSVCTYLGWTAFCPVLMIKSLSFPHHSAPFAYLPSPPLLGQVAITTPIPPSLKLSSPGWPAYWQRCPTWSGGSYPFLAVRDLQRGSQGPKKPNPYFQILLCKQLLMHRIAESIHSSLSPSSSPAGPRRHQLTPISLPLIPEPHNHPWYDPDPPWPCNRCPHRRLVRLVAQWPDEPRQHLQCPRSKPLVSGKSALATDQASEGVSVPHCCPWCVPLHCCVVPCSITSGHTTEVSLRLCLHGDSNKIQGTSFLIFGATQTPTSAHHLWAGSPSPWSQPPWEPQASLQSSLESHVLPSGARAEPRRLKFMSLYIFTLLQTPVISSIHTDPRGCHLNK